MLDILDPRLHAPPHIRSGPGNWSSSQMILTCILHPAAAPKSWMFWGWMIWIWNI